MAVFRGGSTKAASKDPSPGWAPPNDGPLDKALDPSAADAKISSSNDRDGAGAGAGEKVLVGAGE